ncbi:hypothetical protein [Kribbella sp. NBC_00889]|uniref:hypothetical protein n=1 Tax=Kribbella sp. NBC_00889 TaxID=2975974 RepID=UPI003866680A|nr:hypothetical protein OG817_28870 [Kribbella sp. NBC_00889]
MESVELPPRQPPDVTGGPPPAPDVTGGRESEYFLMFFPWIRVGAWAGTALLAAAVVGCGTTNEAGTTPAATTSSNTPSAPASPTATATPPAPPDLSTLPAETLLARTKAAASAAPGVRVKGLLVDSTGDLRLDLQLSKGGGQGAFLLAGTPITYRVVGKDVYMLMSEATIRAMAKADNASKAETSAMLSLLKGKWIKPSKIDAEGRALIDMTKQDTFFKDFFAEIGRPKKTGKKVVDGVLSVGLVARGATLWIDTRTARPVRFQNGAGRDFMTFTDYGRVPAPKAPPAGLVVDGKGLGI